MIHHEGDKIRARLAEIEGVAGVTRGWPRRMEALPCIAVSKAADTPVDFRDDRASIAEVEYYVRIFARRSEAADALAVSVDAAMEEMGYVRTFAYDDDDSEMRIAAMRYKKYV